LEKIDMIDYADIIALNKFDKRGAQDALRDVRKQYQRSRQLFGKDPASMPVHGTIASQFNDPGTNSLYRATIDLLVERCHLLWQSSIAESLADSEKVYIIPPDRTRYLAEIAEESDRYDAFVERQSALATELWQVKGAMASVAQANLQQQP
jgi:methylmalonyl-CoA mutase